MEILPLWLIIITALVALPAGYIWAILRNAKPMVRRHLVGPVIKLVAALVMGFVMGLSFSDYADAGALREFIHGLGIELVGAVLTGLVLTWILERVNWWGPR